MSRITLAVILAVVTFSIGAQPVKCVDASGKVRYIDESMMGQEKCKPVRAEVQFVPAAPGAAPSAKPPGSASPGSAAEREARLKDAQNRLADARKQLAEQEAVRGGDERNYARVEERLKPYQEAVQAAEQEVEQARRAFR
ncbi:MAG TPA: hypothetical protein VEL04_09385 [Burkholderiales bacterium]|nr:hypothetical protein [Burkholderiales bacterium]